MKSNIGAENNPIKLVSESKERALLQKHCKNTERGRFDFHALPDFGEDCYLHNVVYNPHLTMQEVKLAVFFYLELIDGGKIYTTSLSDKFFPSCNYGDGFMLNGDYEDGIAIGTEHALRSKVIFSDKGFYRNLSWQTETMGMKLTAQRLLYLLRRLHDFGYITVTDITEANTYNAKKTRKAKSYRARLRHIRLCKGMQKKDLTDRWLPPIKRQKKPT